MASHWVDVDSDRNRTRRVGVGHVDSTSWSKTHHTKSSFK